MVYFLLNDDIIFYLNDNSELEDFSGDDSDVDKTWEPTTSTNINLSDSSGLDFNEDEVNDIRNTKDNNGTNNSNNNF